MSDKTESVNHPSHYGGDTTYEAIKVIEAWDLDFCLGNTVKYISRAGKKYKDKTLEDLRKASWYLSRKVKQLEEADKIHKEKCADLIGCSNRLRMFIANHNIGRMISRTLKAELVWIQFAITEYSGNPSEALLSSIKSKYEQVYNKLILYSRNK